EEAERSACGEGDATPDGDIGASLGLNAHVTGVAAERAARDLQVVSEEDPLVRMHGVVTQVEGRRDLRIRDSDCLQSGIEVAAVCERLLDLDVVSHAHEESSEASVHAERPLALDVSDDRIRGVRLAGVEEQGIDVELRADEA